jgi:hypothetical protein
MLLKVSLSEEIWSFLQLLLLLGERAADFLSGVAGGLGYVRRSDDLG